MPSCISYVDHVYDESLAVFAGKKMFQCGLQSDMTVAEKRWKMTVKKSLKATLKNAKNPKSLESPQSSAKTSVKSNLQLFTSQARLKATLKSKSKAAVKWPKK